MTTRREILQGVAINGWLCRFRVHRGLTKAATLENCSVAELRQYTLHAGARKTLVSLFVSEFIRPQEEFGMAVSGHFFLTPKANEGRLIYLPTV